MLRKGVGAPVPCHSTPPQTLSAVIPNLKPFFACGGELLMYHGGSDPGSPNENEDYQNAVVNKFS